MSKGQINPTAQHEHHAIIDFHTRQIVNFKLKFK